MFGEWRRAVDRLEVAGRPVRRREEPDGQVGARAVQAQRVEAAISETLCVRLQLVRALDPRGGRIVRLEAADVRHVLPQLLERRLGVEVRIDELGPGARRHGHDVPAGRHAVHDLPGLREIGEEIAAGAGRVEPLERAWRMRTRERDACGMLVGEVEQALAHPRGHVVQRVLDSVHDPFALDPPVEVEDVDVLGPAFVGTTRDLPGDLFLADLTRDRDELTGLDVRAEDREVGELVLPRFDPGHRGETLARMRPCASTHTSRAPASRRAGAPTSSSGKAGCA